MSRVAAIVVAVVVVVAVAGVANAAPVATRVDNGVIVVGGRFVGFMGDDSDAFAVASADGDAVYQCRGRSGTSAPACASMESAVGVAIAMNAAATATTKAAAAKATAAAAKAAKAAGIRVLPRSPSGHTLAVGGKPGPQHDAAVSPQRILVDDEPRVTVQLPFTKASGALALEDTSWSADGLAVGVTARVVGPDAQDMVAVVVDLDRLWPSGSFCCGQRKGRPVPAFATFTHLASFGGFSDDGSMFFVKTAAGKATQSSICRVDVEKLPATWPADVRIADGAACAPLKNDATVKTLASLHPFVEHEPHGYTLVKDSAGDGGGGVLKLVGKDGAVRTEYARDADATVERVQWERDGRYAAVTLHKKSGAARTLAILDTRPSTPGTTPGTTSP